MKATKWDKMTWGFSLQDDPEVVTKQFGEPNHKSEDTTISKEWRKEMEDGTPFTIYLRKGENELCRVNGFRKDHEKIRSHLVAIGLFDDPPPPETSRKGK